MVRKDRTKIYYEVNVEVMDDKYMIIKDYKDNLVVATYIIKTNEEDEQ